MPDDDRLARALTLAQFVRSLTPSQRRFFHDYIAQREASLQQALAELSTGFGRVSREQQQLMADRHALAKP